jgi:uncharacterized protein
MALSMAANIKIVEVHPGAAIGTRIGADHLEHALQYKKNDLSRNVIYKWFPTVGLHQIPTTVTENSHRMDACAAALAAWHWADPTKQPIWQWNENTTSEHPFELCC